MMGRSVYFLTGSDEHGQKIATTAESQGLTPRELCDKNVNEFKELNAMLNVKEDRYIRTTESNHKSFCQWFWCRVRDNGDIYKSSYQGWYNAREENYVNDRDAVATNYLDPDSGVPYERRNEESYFFRMSKYHDEVFRLIKTDEFVVRPESRRNELLSRLEKDRLTDLSISRKTLKWGIPVPDDEDHVMYVWFDALSNYLSGIEYSVVGLNKFWPADVHIVGKDIIWFHCVIWPSMLLSAQIPLPKEVFAHGFVQSQCGTKMSKSLGNVIDPKSLIKENKVSPDTFRYYLCREGHYGSDIKFSMASLIDMHNAELVSVLGNLVHRVLNLAIKKFESKIPKLDRESPLEIFEIAKNTLENLEKGINEKFELEVIASTGMNICRQANKYLSDEAPWKCKDVNRNRYVIRRVLEMIYVAAHILSPCLPKATDEIFVRLGCPKKLLIELDDPNGLNLVDGATVSTGPVLFEPMNTEI